VDVALDVDVDDFDVVGVLAAVLEVFAGVVVAAEFVVLVVLEPLLPHPAISAPQSSTTESFEDRPTITCSPFDLWSTGPSPLDDDR
jgi:hypothetical protein